MAARFWVGGTGTWDNSDTTHWAASSGTAGGQSVPVAGDSVTFDGSSGGGTVTVAATINSGNSLLSLTAGAFTGTLDFSVNNPSITFTSSGTGLNFSGAGSGRIFKLGSGTFSFPNGGGFDFSTITGIGTQSLASATFSMSSSAIGGQQTFNGGTQTYGTLTFNGRSSGQGAAITGAHTFTTVNLTGPLVLTVSGTQTITNLNVSGSSSAYVNFPTITAQSTTVTINVTTASVDRALIRGVVFGTSAVTATNSIDLGNNNMNGGSISAPSGASGGGIIG